MWFVYWGFKCHVDGWKSLLVCTLLNLLVLYAGIAYCYGIVVNNELFAEVCKFLYCRLLILITIYLCS